MHYYEQINQFSEAILWLKKIYSLPSDTYLCNSPNDNKTMINVLRYADLDVKY